MDMHESVLEKLVNQAGTSLDEAEHLRRLDLAWAINEAQMAQGDYKTAAKADFQHRWARLIPSFVKIPPGEEVLVHRARRGIAFSYQLLASLWYESGTQSYDVRTDGLEAKAREAFKNCAISCIEAIKSFKEYKASFTTGHELANRSLRLREVHALAADACLKLAGDYYTRANSAVGQNPSDPGRLDLRQQRNIVGWLDRAQGYSKLALRVYRSAKMEGMTLEPHYRTQAKKLIADATSFSDKFVAALKAQRH